MMNALMTISLGSFSSAVSSTSFSYDWCIDIIHFGFYEGKILFFLKYLAKKNG